MWWTKHPKAHVAIATGALSGVVAVDLDVKPDKNGIASMKAIAKPHGGIPRTRLVRTGSDGRHLLFNHPGEHVQNSVGKLALGIDVRGDGGYVIAAPSGHVSGGAYEELNDAPIADVPAWLLELMRKAAPAKRDPAPRPDFPPATPAELAQARADLFDLAPAIDGDGGRLRTFHACAILARDHGLTWEEAQRAGLPEWNASCVPPWEETELRERFESAVKDGGEPFGGKRRPDPLATVEALIAGWGQRGSEPSEVPALIKAASALRTESKSTRALMVNAIAAATGLAKRDVALPPPVDLEAEARRAAFLNGSDPRLADPRNPRETARAFLSGRADADGRPDLIRWQGEYWRARGPVYEPRSEELVRADLYAFLEGKNDVATFAPIKPDQRMVSVVDDALSSVVQLEAAGAPAWVTPSGADPLPADLVVCANGLLHVPTRTLLPSTRRFFTLNALPYAFNPNAGAPARWEAFLREVFPEDQDAINTLQEIFGLALTPDMSFQRIFLLTGASRGGKGTIASVLTACVGAHNVAGPSLSALGEQFGQQVLIGKSLAIFPDEVLGARADKSAIAGILKTISGTGRVAVHRKNRTDWEGDLTTRLVIVCNEPPALPDPTNALAKRYLAIRFSQSFAGRENPRLLEELLEEIPGILNWALDGLKRLRARGAFVQPASGTEALAVVETLGNPVGEFVKDQCDVRVDGVVPCGDLFEAWRYWAARNGVSAGSAAVFGRDLAATVPTVRPFRRRVQGEQVRHYAGVALSAPGPVSLAG